MSFADFFFIMGPRPGRCTSSAGGVSGAEPGVVGDESWLNAECRFCISAVLGAVSSIVVELPNVLDSRESSCLGGPFPK